MNQQPPIKLIICLGNPGPEYANTYHNAGFLFADYVIGVKGQGSRVKILKSDTYMNTSGQYVKKMMKKYGAKPNEILIAHDESDLPIGTFKLSFDRSSAGHKGAQSVIDALGTKEFWRLRIGVRPQSRTNTDYTQTNAEKFSEVSVRSAKSATPRAKAGTFVLRKIRPVDRDLLTATFDRAAKALMSGKE